MTSKGQRQTVPENEIAVTLTFASGEQSSIVTEIEDLNADMTQVSEHLDDLEQRTATVQRFAGMRAKQRGSSPALKSVAEPTPMKDWDELLDRARQQIGGNEVDIDALLTAREVGSIERRFGDGFTVRSRLDRYDIVAAVAAGVAGVLLDYLVVAVPDKSGLTGALRSLSIDSDNWMSGIAKVPFDRVAHVDLSGFNPNTHRVQTFGHDPLLGWVYGTMDIMRGSLTGVSRTGVVKALGIGQPAAANLPAALGIQAMHLISDIVTPAGLQLPGWSALLTIDNNILGSEHTVGELSRWMYVRGYDTWHLPTLAVPLLGIAAVLRGYFGIRQLLDPAYAEELELERIRVGSERVSDLPRYEVMALIAQGIAVAGNAGKFAMSGSNPLTLNFALWLAFAKSFLARLDRARPVSAMTDTANMNRLILDAGWASIEIERSDLPEIRT